jgi:hypothetical protein
LQDVDDGRREALQEETKKQLPQDQFHKTTNYEDSDIDEDSASDAESEPHSDSKSDAAMVKKI